MESKNPTIRVSISSLKPPFSRLHHFVFITIITLIIINNTAATAASSQLPDLYSKHCDQIVPASIPTTALTDADAFPSFRINTGFFSPAESVDNATNTNTNTISYIDFRTSSVTNTANNDVLYLNSILTLEDWNSTSWLFSHGRKRQGHLRYGTYDRDRPRLLLESEKIIFRLEGFWSSSSGNLCMVGSGSSSSGQGTVVHDVVFKLNYPNATTIATSLVSGLIESLDSRNDSLRYFEPIRVLGFSDDKNYEYTLIEKENTEKFGDDNLSIGLAPAQDVCTDLKFLRGLHALELNYSNDECGNHENCNLLGRGFDLLPKFMFFGDRRCSENGRLHFLIWFSDSSYNMFGKPFDTQTMLVAEGLWDVNRNLLRVFACRISYSSFLANASVEDCSFKLSLRFLPSLSLRNMSVIEGQIWNTNIGGNDKDHSARVGFLSPKIKKMYTDGLAYEYTEIDSITNICAQKARNRHTGSTYPDENSPDLGLSMTVKNSDDQEAEGMITPLFVNRNVYTPRYDNTNTNSNSKQHDLPFNVSFEISFRPQFFGYIIQLGKEVEMYAEGVYDHQTGFLCMKGCRQLDSYQRNLTRNESLDCEILVSVQYSPLNSQDTTKGAIESTRANSDPLYFDPLEVTAHSLYRRRWR